MQAEDLIGKEAAVTLMSQERRCWSFCGLDDVFVLFHHDQNGLICFDIQYMFSRENIETQLWGSGLHSSSRHVSVFYSYFLQFVVILPGSHDMHTKSVQFDLQL